MSRVLLSVRGEAGPIPLRHGEGIEAALAAAGWHHPRYVRAYRPADDADAVVVEVDATTGEVVASPTPAAEAADPELEVREGEVAVEHQRLAAYAVVVEDGRVLLTQLSERVHLVPGWWNLPGGGVDPGEDPVAGLVREVWEETDQQAVVGDLIDVHTQHWLGRAPSGVLEDFQAVRLIYAGSVAEPHEPVVHDVGGSTAQARWVPLDELDELPTVLSVRMLRDSGRIPQS